MLVYLLLPLWEIERKILLNWIRRWACPMALKLIVIGETYWTCQYEIKERAELLCTVVELAGPEPWQLVLSTFPQRVWVGLHRSSVSPRRFETIHLPMGLICSTHSTGYGSYLKKLLDFINITPIHAKNSITFGFPSYCVYYVPVCTWLSVADSNSVLTQYYEHSNFFFNFLY